MMHLVGHSRNKMSVQIDLIHSAAAATVGRQPHLLTLVSEVLRQTTLQAPNRIVTYDLGRQIGYEPVVKTADTEAIFYAKLVKDDVYTKFVKHVKLTPSSCITVHLRRNQQEPGYILHDVWIGQPVPPRPGSEDETEASQAYWTDHAVVFTNQVVQPSSITKLCPY
ncbi:MAG TPA: hypothetical protein VJ843_01570 [Candidatus Saccharimonadales bacterium]|nr:hypothetical protein [Candidatus Saccharimonadales bacterium]